MMNSPFHWLWNIAFICVCPDFAHEPLLHPVATVHWRRREQQRCKTHGQILAGSFTAHAGGGKSLLARGSTWLIELYIWLFTNPLFPEQIQNRLCWFLGPYSGPKIFYYQCVECELERKQQITGERGRWRVKEILRKTKCSSALCLSHHSNGKSFQNLLP